MLEGLKTLAIKRDWTKAHRHFLGGRFQDPFGWLNNVRETWGDELAQDMSRLPGAARLNILPQSFFLGAQVADFAAEFRGGVSEVVRWTLYDIRP